MDCGGNLALKIVKSHKFIEKRESRLESGFKNRRISQFFGHLRLAVPAIRLRAIFSLSLKNFVGFELTLGHLRYCLGDSPESYVLIELTLGHLRFADVPAIRLNHRRRRRFAPLVLFGPKAPALLRFRGAPIRALVCVSLRHFGERIALPFNPSAPLILCGHAAPVLLRLRGAPIRALVCVSLRHFWSLNQRYSPRRFA